MTKTPSTSSLPVIPRRPRTPPDPPAQPPTDSREADAINPNDASRPPIMAEQAALISRLRAEQDASQARITSLETQLAVALSAIKQVHDQNTMLLGRVEGLNSLLLASIQGNGGGAAAAVGERVAVVEARVGALDGRVAGVEAVVAATREEVKELGDVVRSMAENTGVDDDAVMEHILGLI